MFFQKNGLATVTAEWLQAQLAFKALLHLQTAARLALRTLQDQEHRLGLRASGLGFVPADGGSRFPSLTTNRGPCQPALQAFAASEVSTAGGDCASARR